jgi:hypothetical protein
MSVDGGILHAASARLAEHAATLARSAERYGSTTGEVQRIRRSIEAHWSGTPVAERSAARVEALAVTLEDVAPVIDRRGSAGTLDRLSDTATELGVQLQRLDEEYHALLAERDRMQGMSLGPEELPPDLSGIEARIDENRRTRSRRVQDWLDACATTARSARTAALALEGVAARIAAGGEDDPEDDLAPMSGGPISLNGFDGSGLQRPATFGPMAGIRNGADLASSVLLVTGAGERIAAGYERAWNLLRLPSRVTSGGVERLNRFARRSWPASLAVGVVNLRGDITTLRDPAEHRADRIAAGLDVAATVLTVLAVGAMATVVFAPAAPVLLKFSLVAGVGAEITRQRDRLVEWGQRLWEVGRVALTLRAPAPTGGPIFAATDISSHNWDETEWDGIYALYFEEPRDLPYYLQLYKSQTADIDSPEPARTYQGLTLQLGEIMMSEPELSPEANYRAARDYVEHLREVLGDDFDAWVDYATINYPGIVGQMFGVLPEKNVGDANEAILNARIAELEALLPDPTVKRMLDELYRVRNALYAAREGGREAHLLFLDPLEPSRYALLQGSMENACSHIWVITGTNSATEEAGKYQLTAGFDDGRVGAQVELELKKHEDWTDSAGCKGVATLVWNVGDNPRTPVDASRLRRGRRQSDGEILASWMYRDSIAHPNARPVIMAHSAGSTTLGWAVDKLCGDGLFDAVFTDGAAPTLMHIASPGAGSDGVGPFGSPGHGHDCIKGMNSPPCTYDVYNRWDGVIYSPWQGPPARSKSSLGDSVIPYQQRGLGLGRHGIDRFIDKNLELYRDISLHAAYGLAGCFQP